MESILSHPYLLAAGDLLRARWPEILVATLIAVSEVAGPIARKPSLSFGHRLLQVFARILRVLSRGRWFVPQVDQPTEEDRRGLTALYRELAELKTAKQAAVDLAERLTANVADLSRVNADLRAQLLAAAKRRGRDTAAWDLMHRKLDKAIGGQPVPSQEDADFFDAAIGFARGLLEAAERFRAAVGLPAVESPDPPVEAQPEAAAAPALGHNPLADPDAVPVPATDAAAPAGLVDGEPVK